MQPVFPISFLPKILFCGKGDHFTIGFLIYFNHGMLATQCGAVAKKKISAVLMW